MARQTVKMDINSVGHTAEVKDGEIIGWRPITIKDLSDLLGCMAYLMKLEYAMRQTSNQQ